MRCLLSGPARGFGQWLDDRLYDHGEPSPAHRPRSYGPRSTRPTSTRFEKNVAPPPISASRCGVVALTPWPPGECLPHHSPRLTTTPGRTSSVRDASSCTSPRVLNTRTASPSRMPRDRASSGWISRQGRCSERMFDGILAYVEFRKKWLGGVINRSGYGPDGGCSPSPPSVNG